MAAKGLQIGAIQTANTEDMEDEEQCHSFSHLVTLLFFFPESVHNSRNISKHIIHIQTTCNECVACAASQERTVLLLRPVNHAEDLDSEDRPEFRFTLQKFLGWKRGVTLFSPVALCSSVWNCLKDGIELNGDEI